jgi:hypothetical protein
VSALPNRTDGTKDEIRCKFCKVKVQPGTGRTRFIIYWLPGDSATCCCSACDDLANSLMLLERRLGVPDWCLCDCLTLLADECEKRLALLEATEAAGGAQ